MSRAIIKVNGEIYDGWKTTRLKRSIEAISSVFSFDFTDSWTPSREPWGINPQDEIDIEIAGTRLVRGYAEILNANLGTERSYTIQGRDRTCDLVDCSAVVKQYKNISLLDLCNALGAPVGVGFRLQSAAVNNLPFKDVAINPGEKIFDAIDKAVRQRGVLCIPDGSGNVILSLAGTVQADTNLVEGENCKTIAYTLNNSERYSDYKVLGQATSTKGFAGTSTTVSGVSSDAGMKRKRLLIIQAERTVNSAEAKTRAAWEANVRAARAVSVSVEVQGWLQERGNPWMINQTVSLTTKRLGISGKFLICDIEYQQNSGGTTATLMLVPPDAFLSDPTVKKKQSDQVARGWRF